MENGRGGTARGCAGILSAPPSRSSVRQMCDIRGVWFVRRARIPAPANLARRAACTQLVMHRKVIGSDRSRPGPKYTAAARNHGRPSVSGRLRRTYRPRCHALVPGTQYTPSKWLLTLPYWRTMYTAVLGVPGDGHCVLVVIVSTSTTTGSLVTVQLLQGCMRHLVPLLYAGTRYSWYSSTVTCTSILILTM